MHWRTGHSDALGGAPRSPADAQAENEAPETNDLNGTREPAAPKATPGPPAPVPLFAREGAVAAYCLELCGTAIARIATEEVIASPRLSGPPSAVSEGELLRASRSMASGFAPQVLHPGSVRMTIEGARAECAFTIPRLARRANGELDRVSRAALAAHLENCLVCRAAEARHDRAERAFAAVLGATAVIAEPEPAEVAPSPPSPEPAPAPLEPPPVPPAPAALATPPAPAALATPEPEPRSAQMRRRAPSGSTILIATLIVGAMAIAAIALLWASGSGNPNPRSLPPVSSGSSAVALSQVSGPRP